MKRIFNVMMLVVAMTMITLNSFAQAPNHKQRISREQLAEKQAQYIAKDLSLDNETTTKFINTYIKCQKEVWALGPRPRRNLNGNEEQTEQDIKKRFEMSEKILDIRQKYYKEYSKFMTQKQIQRVYEIEKNMMKRFAQRKGKNGQRPMRGKHEQRLMDKNSTK